MISDRISKMVGAKIIEKRYSYRDYQKYRKISHKFELKQRLYFLMQQSKSINDFLEKAEQLHVQIDFSQKHSRFMMTDRAMKKTFEDVNSVNEIYMMRTFLEYILSR